MSGDSVAVDAGLAFLDGLFNQLDAEIEIVPRIEGERLIYALNGETDILRQKPDVASAVSLLTSQAVRRETDERINCELDIDGQLELRRELLLAAADDLASAVVKNGRRAVLEGLTSSERRVVHTRLKEDETVSTYSEGNDQHRLLLIQSAGDE